jgi:tetratricopeptide (TPR) repeat protein
VSTDPRPPTSNEESPVDALLRDGIAALKAGRREQARALLMQVVEQDDQNEKAWLWLSGAVETDDDRRVCLENVLTLNPGHAAARQGLAKLASPQTGSQPTPAGEEIVMRREHAPISPAAAILYPDKQVHEWSWRKTPDLKQVPAVAYQARSSFNDIWSSDGVICAYCAQEVSDDDRRCPRCRRSLVARQYRLEQAGANVYLLSVLTLSLGLQAGVQVFIDAWIQAPSTTLILDIAQAACLLILAGGVYLRQRWAFLGALGLMAIILVASILRAASGVTVESELFTLIALLVPVAQVITSLLGLTIGVFRAGADFELAETRHVMALGQELRASGDFYHAGKRYADKGMWAMAVPFWQRAAAAEPTRVFFQQTLGEAYARLGFFDRSLNVLEAALGLAVNPEVKAEVEKLIQDVQRRRTQESETSQKHETQTLS